MRKKLIFVLLIVFALINVASFSMVFLVKGGSPVEKDTMMPKSMSSSRDLEGIDVTQKYKDYTIVGAEPDTGNTWYVPIIDDYYGGWYLQGFESIINGTYGNIWIGMNEYDEHDDGGTPNDLTDDIWYFGYPWTPVGFP
ncbi:MAG: hypothetical protein ACFFG0_31085, partial [Candidatus Thorarchaeota archaeon]